MADVPATPRDAATVVLLRDGRAGPEVLMLRRHGKVEFAADAWVFPGGAVDAADRRLDPARWSGIDPEALAPRFAATSDLVLGYHVACVREAFEEAGILLARHADGRDADPTAPAAQALRAALANRSPAASFTDWLAEEDLVCDLGALTYHSRWITPAQAPKRFDACFFITRAPRGQDAAFDAVETTDQRWITPAEALERSAVGEMLIWYPTEQTLRSLADGSDVDALLAAAGARPEVRGVEPRLEKSSGGWRVVHPDEDAADQASGRAEGGG